MRGQLVSLGTFFRAAVGGWQAPQAFRTDLNGPGLLAIALDAGIGGTGDSEVLEPSCLGCGAGGSLLVSEGRARRRRRLAEERRLVRGRRAVALELSLLEDSALFEPLLEDSDFSDFLGGLVSVETSAGLLLAVVGGVEARALEVHAPGWKTRWTGAPQTWQVVRASSVIRCMTSNSCPFSQRYS